MARFALLLFERWIQNLEWGQAQGTGHKVEK